MKQILASIMLMTSLIMTSGCSKSDNEQIKELVDTKIEIIEGNDVIKKVDALIAENDLSTKVTIYNKTVSCVEYIFRKYNNPYAQHKEETYKGNQEFYSEVLKKYRSMKQKIQNLNDVKGFKSDKRNVEKYTATQEDFKKEYDVFKKNYFDEVNKRNPELTNVIFPSTTSYFKDGRSYSNYMGVSLLKKYVIEKVEDKYPELINRCVNKVLRISEISSVSDIQINEEENKAEVEITYSDKSTEKYTFVKHIVKNEGKWKEVKEFMIYKY